MTSVLTSKMPQKSLGKTCIGNSVRVDICPSRNQCDGEIFDDGRLSKQVTTGDAFSSAERPCVNSQKIMAQARSFVAFAQRHQVLAIFASSQ